MPYLLDPDMGHWKNLIATIKLRAEKGYTLFYKFSLARKPEKSWPDIDKKILKYYDAYIPKYTRYYRLHKKNLKNFFYQRWRDIGIVLATEKGDFPEELLTKKQKHLFKSLKQEPLILPIGVILEIQIWQDKANNIRVKLTKQTIYAIKQDFFHNNISVYAKKPYKTNAKKYAIKQLKKLQYLPAYPDIEQQIKHINLYAIQSFKKLKLKLHTNIKAKGKKTKTQFKKIYISS